MNHYLRYMLPAFCALYFLLLFIVRAWDVRRQTGKNPIHLSYADDLHGLIGKYFTAWMLLLGAYIIIYCVYPGAYNYFMPMDYLDSKQIKIAGLFMLAVALAGTCLAQGNMRQSWRVGINQDEKTELITTGIFKYSRNPIYVGMLFSVTGLFMVTPNAFTLLLAVAGYILIQVQVRVEEDFLIKMHGQSYLHYKSMVRRFI